MSLETTNNIKKYTPLGGNVDSDRIRPLIDIVEFSILEPALGTALYDKIVTDYNDNNPNNLAGDYLTLYNDYIVHIIRFSVYAEYLKEGRLLAQNGGVYNHITDDGQVADYDEMIRVSDTWRSRADVYIDRMNRFLCDKNISEYDDSQPNNYDISPRDVNTMGGWFFGKSYSDSGSTTGGGSGSSGNYLELE